ncbi:hypothetical protein [Deinococcus navajonensis]|uniref:Uncharacterized protein n=1 Tax=Deinococcus navajonensis TaxID=309884 RepID=A0ABV8XM34_9DEIO
MDVTGDAAGGVGSLRTEENHTPRPDTTSSHPHAYAHLLPFVQWRAPGALALNYGVNQKKVYRKQTRQMQATGWYGPPLLVWRTYLLSGGVRWVAARHADLAQVPVVDLSEEEACLTLFGEAAWKAIKLYHGSFGSGTVISCLQRFGVYPGNLNELELI